MYVVKFKQHGDLNCQEMLFGPFTEALAAEDALGWLPMLYGQGGREWPSHEDDMYTESRQQCQDGYRTIVELTDPAPYYNGMER